MNAESGAHLLDIPGLFAYVCEFAVPDKAGVFRLKKSDVAVVHRYKFLAHNRLALLTRTATCDLDSKICLASCFLLHCSSFLSVSEIYEWPTNLHAILFACRRIMAKE